MQTEADPRRVAPRFAVLVLAAGRSSRMGGRNKLLEPVGGRPMVSHVVDAAIASRAQMVVVVSGHQAEDVEAALGGRPVVFVRNPDFAEGLSTSLRRGLSALPRDVDAVVVCLGDMPLIRASTIDALAAGFAPEAGRAICVPSFEGRRGNPILWGRRFFAEMAASTGDSGARRLLSEYAELVHEVPVASPEIFMDVDTVSALEALDRRSE
jgi:molybdenum cofactor cytidylyltransferase